MPLVKKVSSSWTPIEHQDLKVGDIIFVENAEKLIELGDAVYCDDKGNELAFSEEGECVFPIILKNIEDARKFIKYMEKEKKVEITEKTKDRVESIVNSMEEPKLEVIEQPKKRTPEELKTMRIENLRKAREARKAKAV